MPFNPFKLEVADNYLVQYFQCIASRSLTTFGHDPTDVGNVLMRMTLANSSPSAAAVLRSMLALSSLHRDGLQPQAAELKISALRALAAASKNNISVTEAAQHVAAGMLLSIKLPAHQVNGDGHLSDVCDTISAKPPRTMFAKDLDDYKNYLKILRWRIRSISPSDSTPRNGPGSTMIVELFQLAMLVYLNRASGNLLERTAETEQLVRRAFAIFSELGSCERQFPLFILGCEARTDDERCTVLDLISRTEKVASSRSLLLVRKMVQAIWNQDDLADGEIDYEETLSVIISCCAILPTFV
ncbi:uncharacterized protein ATNIH1004_009457 [Aspergillus tanneri]|uniref:Uncharacterized protein n=1 Tax=Aspergillus tanneri TaxID=1220188 RepID=A0A5M9M6Q3_9EURO|nr:uncharacterized protein ATNIH1004_009457 [Aspergillus tanneri]KAA8642705.1 hypothetical protein ATNIH1004_009457 [Aspergillus tanneri]